LRRIWQSGSDGYALNARHGPATCTADSIRTKSGFPLKQAFREVSDALAGYRRASSGLRRSVSSNPPKARAGSPMRAIATPRAATSRCWTARHGSSTAELRLVDAQLAELLGFVEIYRTLGGGWQ
jgi:hypothetical protein